MTPRRKQRESGTHIRNKRSASGMVADRTTRRESKKFKQHIAYTDTEDLQNRVHLPMEWQAATDTDNDMIDIKQAKSMSKLLSDDGLFNTKAKGKAFNKSVDLQCIYSNSPSKASKSCLSKNWTDKNVRNLCSSNLLNTSTASSPAVYTHRKNLVASSVNLPLIKKRLSESLSSPSEKPKLVAELATGSKDSGSRVNSNNTNSPGSLSNRNLSKINTKARHKPITSRAGRYSLSKSTAPRKIMVISPESKLGRRTRSISSTLHETRNTNSPGNAKKATVVPKEPVVLLQRLGNIVRLSSSSPSLSSPKIGIRVDGEFTSSNVNVSRKTYNSVLESFPNAIRSPDGENRSNGKRKRDESSGTLLEKESVHRRWHSPRHDSIKIPRLSGGNEASPELLLSSTPKDQQGFNRESGRRGAREMLDRCDNTFELPSCNTYDVMDEVSVKSDKGEENKRGHDDTYELIEPKTPKLRKMLQKERLDVVERKGAKKNFRVRFTSPSPKKIKRNPPDDSKNVASNNDRESRKSIIDTQTQPNGLTDRNITATSSFESRIKRSDPKYSFGTKKIPNFAEIHKKMFDKAESVVDARSRLKSRHATLTATKVNVSLTTQINIRETKQLPKKSHTGSYNRFGFKIRKQEAKDCIMGNNNLKVARNKQQNRAILNGVRTNRRFELQMKLRNIKL